MKHAKLNLLLLFGCLSLSVVCAEQGTNSAVFEIRLAVPATPGSPPVANSERMALDRTSVGGKPYRELFDVDKNVLLDQKDLKAAKVILSPSSGKPVIDVIFTPDGRRHFAEITRHNIDKRLAVIIEGRVYCAPVIKTEIPGGQAEITGNFTQEEAEALCEQINAVLKD